MSSHDLSEIPELSGLDAEKKHLCTLCRTQRYASEEGLSEHMRTCPSNTLHLHEDEPQDRETGVFDEHSASLISSEGAEQTAAMPYVSSDLAFVPYEELPGVSYPIGNSSPFSPLPMDTGYGVIYGDSDPLSQRGIASEGPGCAEIGAAVSGQFHQPLTDSDRLSLGDSAGVYVTESPQGDLPDPHQVPIWPSASDIGVPSLIPDGGTE